MTLEVNGSMLATGFFHDQLGRAHIIQPINGLNVERPLEGEARVVEFGFLIVLQLFGRRSDFPEPFSIHVALHGPPEVVRDNPGIDMMISFDQSWPENGADPDARLATVDLRKSLLRYRVDGRHEIRMLLPGGVPIVQVFHLAFF